jgi:hypothetical protein
MRQSDDPRDRLFAEIQERLGSLEKASEKPEFSFRPSSKEQRHLLLRRLLKDAKLLQEAGMSLGEVERQLMMTAKYEDKT